jgi:hypothetical protein
MAADNLFLLFLLVVSAAMMRSVISDRLPYTHPLGPLPWSTASSSLVIDTFNDTAVNSLGFFHGKNGPVEFGDFEEINGGDYLKVTTGDIDGTTFSTHLIYANYQSFLHDVAGRRLR